MTPSPFARRVALAALLGLSFGISAGAPAREAPPWILNPPDLETVIIGGPGEDGGYNVHPTIDGGYVIAGCITSPGRGRDLVVYKLRSDLTRDPAFGRDGRWVAGSSGDDQAIDVLEIRAADGQPSGYLVVGYVSKGDGDFADCGYHGKSDIAIARLTTAGNLDPAFGRGGLRLYGGGEDDEVLVHLFNYSEPGERLVQTDDGFLVAGMTRSVDGDLAGIATIGHAEARDVMIFKIDAHGDFMPGFADHGILRIGMKPGPRIGPRTPNDFVFSLKREAGGFVAGGYHLGAEITVDGVTVHSPGNSTDIGDNTSDEVQKHQMDGWIFRFDDHGRLRTDWADRGFVFLGGSRQEKLYDVELAPDGGYFVTGRTASWDLSFSRPAIGPKNFDMVLLKVDARGRLDPAFGKDGLIFLGGDESDQGLRVIHLGGDLLWLGQSLSRPPELAATLPADSGRQVVVLRLAADGRALRRWSLGSAGEDKPAGFCLDRDGRVVITGFRDRTVFVDQDLKEGSHRDLLLMRFNPTLK